MLDHILLCLSFLTFVKHILFEISRGANLTKVFFLGSQFDKGYFILGANLTGADLAKVRFVCDSYQKTVSPQSYIIIYYNWTTFHINYCRWILSLTESCSLCLCKCYISCPFNKIDTIFCMFVFSTVSYTRYSAFGNDKIVLDKSRH